MRFMNMKDIKISESFAATMPKEKKIKDCRDFWERNHKQDRYVVVNRDNTLIDGYIQYLVLKEKGVTQAEVKISDTKHKCWKRKNRNENIYQNARYKNNETTYIYGIHSDNENAKEYIWRVPDSWVGWENDLLPGDKILVRTKYGVKPVIVTKIEWLDKCPVDTPVRKVYRKIKC